MTANNTNEMFAGGLTNNMQQQLGQSVFTGGGSMTIGQQQQFGQNVLTTTGSSQPLDPINVILEIQKTTAATNAMLSSYMQKNDAAVAEVNQKVDNQTATIQNLVSRVEQLEKASPATSSSHFADWSEKLKEVERNLNAKITMTADKELLGQAKLAGNLVLIGVPYIEGEDLRGVWNKICQVIGVSTENGDVSEVFRKKHRDGNAHGPVVVKLTSMKKKLEIVAAKKKKGAMAANELGFAETTMVYVNHHTTPFFGKLLHLGRRAVIEKQCQQIWLCDGGMAVRTNGNDSVKVVKTIADFNNVIGARNSNSISPSPKRKKAGRPKKDGKNTNQSNRSNSKTNTTSTDK